MDLLLIITDRQGELKDVVRLTELNLLCSIASRFQTVDDHIKRSAL